jgi:hypothetical protein
MKTCPHLAAAVALVLLGLAQGAPAQNAAGQPAARSIQFKYPAGKPLTYAMTIQAKTTMDMKVGGETVKTKTDFAIRCKLKLTPKAQKSPGVTTCALSTSDVEQDVDTTNPAGNTVIKLRGAHTTVTLNGNVIVDTEKDIGTAQAKEFRKDLAPLYLTGELDLDSRGRVGDIRGEPAFVDFWKEANDASVGFFGIVFPEGPVAEGGSWKEEVVVRKMGEIVLEKEGMRSTVTFTRQPDTTSPPSRLPLGKGKGEGPASRFIAMVKLSAPFDQKDLVGYLSQAGQKTRLDIPTFRRKVLGTIRFDLQQGVLIDSDTKIDADAAMNASVQGQQLNMDTKIEVAVGLKLAPEGAAKPPK